ncbi:MAG: Eco57I restriction-modification methylase domain-containing protein [Phycisphaerae bacterium]
MSFVSASYLGTKQKFSNYRRYTYFISPETQNRTFQNQLEKCKFEGVPEILEVFSLATVSNEFYKDFKPKFDNVLANIQGADTASPENVSDFALLFVVRILFLGFVQKKGWLGSHKFLQEYLEEYRKLGKQDEFYAYWLEPLFFEALNSPPGQQVDWGNNDFSKQTQENLQMAPFLNGELFKKKNGVDNIGMYISDSAVYEFFNFLFQYNFTIDECSATDEELGMNPEFLGIIFEKFVNKAHGSVYTPRTEVDYMCRLSLLTWLEKKSEFETSELYHLFFREAGKGCEYDDDQKDGNFSKNEISALYNYLEKVTICDPAAGSGAFEVGMMIVLCDIFEKLSSMPNCDQSLKSKSKYELKKNIIRRSLYGVEVQGYAVWINQLRLWLSLFVEMDDSLKTSANPILPSLNFKIRRGDSLVQIVGGKLFPIQGHADVTPALKRKITALKKAKIEFFNNTGESYKMIHKRETDVFREIIQAEIGNRKDALVKIENPVKQAGFGFHAEESEKAHASKIKDKQKRVAALNSEIYELDQELRSIVDERPLVWSIEFSEIFFGESGGFDIVIGNPPYIEQEGIRDPLGSVSSDTYKKLLFESLKIDYPSYFKNAALSKRSDLSVYFYIKTIRLLNKDGVHCFICTNTWLDAGYGAGLQRFFVEKAKLRQVIYNHAKRSFPGADVNTVITIADSSLQDFDKSQHKVKFVSYKRPFEETVFAENLIDIAEAEEKTQKKSLQIYLATAEQLYSDAWVVKRGGEEYVGDKWGGKYLRAPDIFFTVMEKGKNKFVRLGDVAELRRGITTGCDSFFYLTESAVNDFGIEEEFLKPVIKSSKECMHVLVSQGKYKNKIFFCDKAKKELKGTRALEYIEWGEKQPIKVKQGKNKGEVTIGFNNVSSTKARKKWWSLGDRSVSLGIIPCSVGDTFRFYINDLSLLANKRLYLYNGEECVLRFLNSTLYFLLIELNSPTGLGGGLLDLTVDQYNTSLCISENLNLPIIERKIESVFIESGIDPKSAIPIEEQEPNPLPDRKQLDDIVFDAIGLSEEERKDVYRGVCRLVWDRINKAKS